MQCLPCEFTHKAIAESGVASHSGPGDLMVPGSMQSNLWIQDPMIQECIMIVMQEMLNRRASGLMNSNVDIVLQMKKFRHS